MQEIAVDPASAPIAWAIRDGRLLRFGPAWPESSDRVIFDACSGDYWVLDALGHVVVRRLLDDGALSTERLNMALTQGSAPATEPGNLVIVLERLSEAGLIQTAAPASS